jgi:nucleoside-diphosphate-sugar epimerase
MTTDETVLVTGAGGFIGRHLVENLLDQDQSVIALDVHPDGIEHLRGHPRLQICKVDLCSHESVNVLIQKADVIYHLAAAHLEVGVDDDHYRAVNVDALKNMLQAAVRKNIRRFVHCSTVGVYGSLAVVPADENTPCVPDIAYELTKLEGEEAVRNAVSSDGLSAIIIRPSWVYGPECPRTLKLLRAISKRRFFFVGNGVNLRHPIYIADLLTAFKLAGAVPIPSGETVIIAGPSAVTTRELVEKIIAQLKIHYRPPSLPLGLVLAGCQMMEKGFSIIGREPPFSSRSIKFFTDNSSFSIDKARHLLGYEPAVSLDDGLSRTLEYVRQKGLIE